MALDERLRRELDRAARPADPSGIYEHLIRRRERRRIARKVQSGLLAVAVIAGSIAGVYGLSRVFGEREPQTAAPTPTNGLIALSLHSDPAMPAIQRIALLDPAGGEPRYLTTGDRVATVPAWSPDGTQLVFWRAGREEQNGLWIMNADGSQARLLYETTASIWTVRWSPDGTRIAFVNVVVPEGPATELDFSEHLYLMNADGTDVMPLITDGHVTDFDWSPDGSRLVIERQFAIGQDRIGSDLAIVGADGGREHPLTSDGVSRDPTWSPDGSSIIYVGSATGESRNRDLFAIAPDGSERVQLTDDEGTEEDPVFSPDGSLVAYTRFPHGDGSACELVVMEPDGTAPRVIATKQTLEGCPVALAWQPILAEGEISPQPSPSPSPTENPRAEGARDIGLGYTVCHVSTVPGSFLPGGETQTAVVGTEPRDGSCRLAMRAVGVVGIDVDGDGLVDMAARPVECQQFCSAFAAPDVDGDGTDELLVQNIQFSIAGLRLFDVGTRGGETGVWPVTVATPGYPEGGLAPGAEPQLWIGGDGFNLDELQCAEIAGERVLVQTSASMVPPDTPDSVWQATETTFALNADGTVSVVGTRSFEEPVEQGGPSFWNFDDGICGARLPYPHGGG